MAKWISLTTGTPPQPVFVDMERAKVVMPFQQEGTLIKFDSDASIGVHEKPDEIFKKCDLPVST